MVGRRVGKFALVATSGLGNELIIIK